MAQQDQRAEGTMSDNEYEEANRARKVYALVKLCEERGWTAEEVATFNADNWAITAKRANVNTPSDRTKTIVLHVLRERSDG